MIHTRIGGTERLPKAVCRVQWTDICIANKHRLKRNLRLMRMQSILSDDLGAQRWNIMTCIAFTGDVEGHISLLGKDLADEDLQEGVHVLCSRKAVAWDVISFL